MRRIYLSAVRRVAVPAVLAGAAVMSAVGATKADVMTLHIDPLSSLTAGGNLYGEPYNEQGPGSLVARYFGTLVVDITPSSIQFLGGSQIFALDNGNWSPAPGSGTGSESADYGAFTNDTSGGQPITIQLASRGLVADLTSGVLSLAGGNFSASGINFGFTQGGTDWSVILNATGGSVQMGHSTLVGQNGMNTGGTGSWTGGSGYKTLTIPIDVGIPIDGDENGSIDSLFALTGQLIAVQYQAQYGDYDLDGDVDGADFVAWQTSFPSVVEPGGGDGDGDGDIDGAEFVIWQTHFPFAPSADVSPVPEPASWLLAVGLVTSALIVRRLRRSAQ